jgi:hypothetical protein
MEQVLILQQTILKTILLALLSYKEKVIGSSDSTSRLMETFHLAIKQFSSQLYVSKLLEAKTLGL